MISAKWKLPSIFAMPLSLLSPFGRLS
jgi:hypothetical protein